MATKPNRSERRTWDTYVSEARKTTSEVDLPNGETLTIYIPSAESIESLTDDAGIWVQMAAVMGAENAEKLREHAGDVPVTALSELLNDVMDDLGVRSGN